MRQHLTDWGLLVIRYTNVHYVHHVHIYFDNVVGKYVWGTNDQWGLR